MRMADDRTREALASEYALGTLRGAARRRFERLLAGDADLRARVSAWERRLAPLSDRVEPVPVPPRVWQSLESRLGFARARPAWRPTLALAATLLVAIAGALLWQPLYQRFGFNPAIRIAFEDSQHQLLWRIDADPSRNEVRVRALRDVGGAPDKSYELWLLRGEGQAPVSLGVLPEHEGEQRRATAALAIASGSGFAVSLEPRGGSPTGAPTGPVLFVQKFSKPA